MSEEQFIVDDANGAKLVPVEAKEPLVVTPKKKRPYNRKAKTVVPVKVRTSIAEQSAVTESVPDTDGVQEDHEWYCSTCRENIADNNVMKLGAGDNRWAIFCPQCQKSLGFLHPDLDKKLADIIKNNPTGK